MTILRFFKLVTVLFTLILVNVNAYADGFIVVPRPPRPLPYHFSPFPLEVVYHRVNVNISGQIAETRIDQVFYNPTNRRLEGYYLFPLPKNAVLKKFSMFVNGKEIEAELLDAKKARGIYEDIVRRMRDPALLEYSSTGVFRARIFPIEPRSKKRIKISYNEVLEKDNNTIEYLYPLNTEKFSAKPLKDVSVNLEINSNESIKNVYCPTHKVEIIRKGKKKAIVSYEEREVKPDIDFKIYYTIDEAQLGFSLLSYKKDSPAGYFFLSLSPGFDHKNRETLEKDISFVLDVSGSMVGEKLSQAKKALLFCVENLNKGDRFEIIRFSTEAESLFNKLSSFNKKNLEQARQFIKDLRAIGGTNIDEALNLALKIEKSHRPYLIIFITDGKPTIGETNEELLLKKIKEKNISNIRIFTFGIGNEINTHLLDKLTEISRAYRSYISPAEDIEIKISNFYAKIQSPILTDMKLRFSGNIRVKKMYPADLPDLFKGSSISILGRYSGSGQSQIILEGRVGDSQRRFAYRGNFTMNNEKNDFIPPLWAARRIGDLLDKIRLHGKEKELIDEIIYLARKYGIVTPYTSYLIVEDERSRVSRRELRHIDQTLGGIPSENAPFVKKSAEEYSNIKMKYGSASVQISKEFQQLNKAENYVQMQPGKSRLNIRDKFGRIQNVAQQVKNIQGRAIYNNGQSWVDSHIQDQKYQKTIRIQFASEAFFKLLKDKPLAGQFLALGQNVRFILKDVLYEIYE